MIHKVTIEVIHPTSLPRADAPKDEDWFRRETVRTFKVSGDYELLANRLLEAYLETHEGAIGTWTATQWFPDRKD